MFMCRSLSDVVDIHKVILTAQAAYTLIMISVTLIMFQLQIVKLYAYKIKYACFVCFQCLNLLIYYFRHKQIST